VTLNLRQLVVRRERELRKKGVARVKAIQPSGAGQVVVVESFVDGQWVESRALAPPEAYGRATVLDVASSRKAGKLPPAKGLYPISDQQLSLDLRKPSMTEAEIDDFVLDGDAESDLKVRLLKYVQRAGYPAIRQ
jgi:hypothetical protein